MRTELTVYDQEVNNKINRAGRSIHDEVRDAVVQYADSLVDYIRNVKMPEVFTGSASIFPPTGALAESIQSEIKDDGQHIEASVFSDGSVPYARIHEYGGDIYPVRADYLHFFLDVFPEGAEIVTQHVHMPERSYLRSSFEETKDNLKLMVRAAIKRSMD